MPFAYVVVWDNVLRLECYCRLSVAKANLAFQFALQTNDKRMHPSL